MFSFRYSPSECVLTEKYVYNINKTKSLLDAIFLSLILQSLLLLCLILQRLILLSLIQNADLPNFQLLHHPLQYFNVYSMSIQCTVHSIYIQFNIHSMFSNILIVCRNDSYWLTYPKSRDTITSKNIDTWYTLQNLTKAILFSKRHCGNLDTSSLISFFVFHNFVSNAKISYHIHIFIFVPS